MKQKVVVFHKKIKYFFIAIKRSNLFQAMSRKTSVPDAQGTDSCKEAKEKGTEIR
jgi:hypothetical protein